MRSLVAALAVLCLVATPSGAAELERARTERVDLQGRLGAVTAELDALAVRQTDGRAARDQLVTEVAALEAEAAVAAAALAARARYAYAYGSPTGIEFVLGASGSVAAAERARLLALLARDDQATVERGAIARESLASRRAQLEAVLGVLAADEARAAALQVELDAAFVTAAARETDLADRASRQRDVSRGAQRGTYACPVAAPLHFRDTWGAPRSGGRAHQGVDIFAPMGVDVYAMTGGVVSRHSRSRLGGLGLYLAGDDGHSYYYAHLLEILPGFEPGRRVVAGEHIARNGDSGNARGGAPHVHFEVRPGGAGPVNPYPFSAAACF